ncbi:MAG: NAD(P)H-binding protein, partial [Deltaproteobacteria bacterium]|nr:NAD(P)H-binding protein [Deltaproteobacteria bacterium]
MLASYLLDDSDLRLRLMVHKKDVPQHLRSHPRSEVVRADLSAEKTLYPAVSGVDAIVHFAGVLFKARPEKFLPNTNTRYFENLVDAANREGVEKIILISFPHVEGPTTTEAPASGRLDGDPVSVHAQTRLMEERYLFDNVIRPVSLRAGMVYGRGILMVDAARWFARRMLLGVWKERTQIHLISKVDFCRATANAIQQKDANGIYHLGDEGNDSLQEFLDIACEQWGVGKPWRMPLWMIYGAAKIFEIASSIFGIRSPLTR